jgi:hypothetical protein
MPGSTAGGKHYQLSGFELDPRVSRAAGRGRGGRLAWHHDAATFRRDRQRQNVLVLAGWTVLRFTWSDLTYRPDRVIHDVRTALNSQAAA